MKRNLFVLIVFTLLFSSVMNAQNSDQRMKQLVEERKQNNLTSNDHGVFTIQIYNGLSESKANASLGSFNSSFSGYSTNMFFDSPEWKVQVGKFNSEIDAYKALEKIRQNFPGAFKLKVRK